jgi:hypothetical protein
VTSVRPSEPTAAGTGPRFAVATVLVRPAPTPAKTSSRVSDGRCVFRRRVSSPRPTSDTSCALIERVRARPAVSGALGGRCEGRPVVSPHTWARKAGSAGARRRRAVIVKRFFSRPFRHSPGTVSELRFPAVGLTQPGPAVLRPPVTVEGFVTVRRCAVCASEHSASSASAALIRRCSERVAVPVAAVLPRARAGHVDAGSAAATAASRSRRPDHRPCGDKGQEWRPSSPSVGLVLAWRGDRVRPRTLPPDRRAHPG